MIVLPALSVLSLLAALSAEPPPTSGGKSDEPTVESRGSPRLGGGSSGGATQSSGGGTTPQLFFADIVGKAMPLTYCRIGEPCQMVFSFTNIGAAVAAGQVIPDPVFTIDGVAATPSALTRSFTSGTSWATSERREWLAALAPSIGNHQVRAVLPRLATEKQGDNNASSGPLTVGRTDMAIRLKKDSVDAGLRYEVKAVVSNKGTVPTGPLSVLAVLSINHHVSTPPTLDACFANPGLSGCVMEKHTVDSLAPGVSRDWKIGGKVPASSSVAGRALVDCSNPTPCADADPSNNSDTAHFGN